MKVRVLPLVLVALALALFLGAPLLAEEAKGGNTHTGTVVSVSGEKLVMTGKDGKQHTHMLAEKGKVTCDGKECKLDDLKPGQKIRVTTDPSNKEMVQRVDALDKNKDFEKVPSGVAPPK